jgi:hypothetical protein
MRSGYRRAASVVGLFVNSLPGCPSRQRFIAIVLDRRASD